MKKDIIKETKKGYEVEIQSISIKEDCLSIRFSTNEESNIVSERLKHIWIRSGWKFNILDVLLAEVEAS